MEVLQTLAVGLGLAALSGYSLYLTVFATGLAVHFHWITLAPQFSSLSVLGETPLLLISGALFVLEFFADKIPWIDSIWDAVHTLIRPIGGALLAIQALGHPSPEFDIIVGLLAGSVTFATHSLKAGTRLIVNQSPEPFSNVAVSFGENALVFGGLALLWTHPVIAFAVLVLCFTLALFLLPRLWRIVRAKLFFIVRKLSQPPGANLETQLLTHLPGRYEQVFRKLTKSTAIVAWAELCVSGKGKHLAPDRLGYLFSTVEEPAKLYFVTRGWLAASGRLLEIEEFHASIEPRFLFDELVLASGASRLRYLFRFDRSRPGVASQIVADLQRRAAPRTEPSPELVNADLVR
jgi:Domain of unknown function (DUF4126)